MEKEAYKNLLAYIFFCVFKNAMKDFSKKTKAFLEFNFIYVKKL